MSRRLVSDLVVLYSRPGCHLCDEARAALDGLRATRPFELRELNVEDDAELERSYGLELPVIAVNGEVVARAPVDIDAVRAALAAARDGDPRVDRTQARP